MTYGSGSNRSLIAHWTAVLLSMGALSIAGCIQLDPLPSPEPSATPVTGTPTVFFPTLIPTSTATPLPTGSPMPDLSYGLGEVLFQDDFSSSLNWAPVELAPGGVSVSNGRLRLSVRTANSLFMAISPFGPFTNAYLEVEARAEVCSDNDEFGLAFRISDSFEHYRFMLTCQGEARVVGVVDGTELVLVPNTSSTAIIPGLLISNRLAIWMEGDQFRFLINDEIIFADRDVNLRRGSVGLAVRARQSGQTTASFDNFMIRSLLATPSSTPAE